MCGICGLVERGGGIGPEPIGRMTEIMRHRGPDAGDVWISPDRTVALGNRRLAIIDLDPRSNQPFRSDDGSVVLTYNGEIYNYREIRRELQARGRAFRTQSDTEVIVCAYQEWGLECVHRFRGMFAFGLYDLAKRRLWLVRDRLGIKPLLYYHKGERFAFASEPQQFAQSDGFDTEVDTTALYDCLTYNYVPAPKTALRHVRKLEAGHWLLVEDGEIRNHRYWDVPAFGEAEISEATAVERLRERLDEAVRLRLIADVPVGVLLSGGVDSSSVAAYSQKNHKAPLHTFSVGFDVAAKNELEFANEMAAQIGSTHVTRTYRVADARNDARKVMQLYGEPHGDSSILPTAVVSRMAREHVTVALSGDGGDEVFWGYTRYLQFAHYSRRHRLPLRDTLRALADRTLAPETRGRVRLRRRLTDGFDLWTLLLDGLTSGEKRRWLDPDVFAAFRDYDDYWAYRKYWKPELPLATRLQYLDLKTYLADDILVKVDRASMSVSLEARVPLLDHVLVSEVFSWPDSIRSDGRTLKYIFKKAMKGILPDRILRKRKQGFSIPWRAWIGEWEELRNLRGDGTFFLRGRELPDQYMILSLQQWLNTR